jgi:DNA-binding NarL/FixJ family response regulator
MREFYTQWIEMELLNFFRSEHDAILIASYAMAASLYLRRKASTKEFMEAVGRIAEKYGDLNPRLIQRMKTIASELEQIVSKQNLFII